MSGVRGPTTRGGRAPAGHLALRVPGGNLLLPRRALIVAGLLTLLLVIVAVVALGLGDYPLTPLEVLSALTGQDGFASTIVLQWRLPRIAAALILGAALGASGALFQTLTRNPLGSPDIIGFTTGSYTGAIVVLTVLGSGVASMAAGALVGGLLTAAVVYVLAWRGGVQGFRLIVVGIGVTAMLTSLNTYLLLRARTEVAMTASIWGAGALDTVSWHALAVAAVPLLVLGGITWAVVRPLRQLEMGDDAAIAHGVRAEGTRLAVLVAGVGLVALVTAVAGPIAFIALVAPQIAARLVRGSGLPIGNAALMGSTLLLLADLVAQHVIPGSVPVGVVTVVIGGLYLIVLLVKEARKKLS